MTPVAPQRGHVYRMEDPGYGRLHCLVIAVSPPELKDDVCQALRVTVTHNHRLSFPGWVRMRSGDPAAGYVIVSVPDLAHVDFDELTEDLGPLSMETMVEVEKALRTVLGL